MTCTGDSMPVLVRRDGSRSSLRPLRGLLTLLVLALLAAPVHARVPESSLAGPTAAPAVRDLAQPEAASADWMTRVQRHLVAREYEVGTNAEGLQAPNRAHNLRTYFDATGIRVLDRTAAGGPELLSLRLMRIGRGASSVPVDPGKVTSEGARVEIRRRRIVERSDA